MVAWAVTIVGRGMKMTIMIMIMIMKAKLRQKIVNAVSVAGGT